MKLRKLVYFSSAALLCACAVPASAAENLLIGPNGHVYGFESSTAPAILGWQQALDNASFRTFGGVSGHLPTISDATENSFVKALYAGQESWIGLTDNENYGGFEAGTDGNSAGWVYPNGDSAAYRNFAGGEPNDFGTGEDAAQFQAGSDQWNDHIASITGFGSNNQPGGPSMRYAVEYDLNVTPATIPAWKVTAFFSSAPGSITNLAAADALIAGTNLASQTTNYMDVSTTLNSGSGSHFSTSNAVPGVQTGIDLEDFAVKGTGYLQVVTPGTYTFGVNTDDGSRLRIDGLTVITDDVLSGPHDVLGQVNLTAGFHTIEWTWFERGGGGIGELYGAFGAFNTFGDTNTWQPVGTDSFLQVTQVPEPSTLAMFACAALGMLAFRRFRSA